MREGSLSSSNHHRMDYDITKLLITPPRRNKFLTLSRAIHLKYGPEVHKVALMWRSGRRYTLPIDITHVLLR